MREVDETLANLKPAKAPCDRCRTESTELDFVDVGKATSRWLCPPCVAITERKRAEAVELERLRPIPPTFHWATFAAPELLKRAPKAAVEKARAALLVPRVVLVGASGTGKTSLGCAMIRDRLDAGQDVAVALAWRLGGSRAKHPLGEDEPTDVKRAMSCRLLLLDDMGSERNVASNAVPDVVFERHAEGRPLWVTTWMTPEKMAERYGDGIARRVFEGATVIDCAAVRSPADQWAPTRRP